MSGVDHMRLPENLVTAANADRTPERREWIASLPNLVDELARRWDLTVEPPYQPGGQCSWVAPVRDRTGRDLALKVGWAHEEALHEPDALRLWNGDGAVLLYDAYAEGATSALLMERCVPGTPLGQRLDEAAQDLIVADLLRRLWRSPTGPFRTLEAMCRMWADEFEGKLAATDAHPLDPGLVRAGVQLFRDLPWSAPRHVLLCTDLHAENVLAARREPWLVIDPKPYVGDPTYDPLQHMLNCRDSLERDPTGYAHRIAGLVELDPDRLLLWLFARCVVESIEAPWLGDIAARVRP